MGRISLFVHLLSLDNPFPLTPALSLRERPPRKFAGIAPLNLARRKLLIIKGGVLRFMGRENRIPVHLERPQPRVCGRNWLRFPLSLRERAGVRGKTFIVIAVQKLSAPAWMSVPTCGWRTPPLLNSG